MEDSEFNYDLKTPMCQVKTCRRCGKTKPATNRYFIRSKKTGDGFKTVCKECYNRKRNATMAKCGLPLQFGAIKEASKELRIADMPNSELFEELQRRGYKGTLTETRTHVLC